MQRAARETLRDIDFRSSQGSGCEDTGQPAPRIIADVLAWRHRGAVNEYLVRDGWTKQDFVTFRSPDGAYLVNVVMSKEKGVPLHANLSFAFVD